MILLDLYRAPWREGDGWPEFVELEAGENPRAAARALPARLLVGLYERGFREDGVKPPKRTVTELREWLEGSLRRARRSAPKTRAIPISQASRELAVPERTLRDQIRRGVREAAWTEGRLGRELAIEVPVAGTVRVRTWRIRVDPRGRLADGGR